jgi:hypothetical protein
MKKCKFCKEILRRSFPEHGYGMTREMARRVTKTRELADYIERVIHYVWKLKLA